MRKTALVIAVSGLVLILCICFMPLRATAVQNHTPVFTWQHRGGSVNPEQWIFDGDVPLAMFENRTVEQPALQLMFFNQVPRPVVLRHIKLTPDGAPLIECIQLYCKCGAIVTDRLADITVQGQGTDRIVIGFITQDQWKVATSRRILTLTYDNEKGSYIYDFQGVLEFHSPELFNGTSTSFEFTDPWFVGCPGPALEFPGMWKKRYQKFVYEAADGSIRTIPINHFTTSHKGNIRLKRDGMFLTAFEPDGNPAIQFVGDTADKSSISICWWGYDFHLSRSVTPDELFEPVPVHFRIFQCPNTIAQNLLKQSVTPPLKPDEWGGKAEYPVYERVSSFDKGIQLDGTFDGNTDPFPWHIAGIGAEWDKTSGRTDSYSLKITKNESGLTRWKTFQGDGEGYFAEQWLPCKGYKVSCYVRTDGVSGRGSTLAVQYHVPNSPQQYPIITASRIRGTTGWTRLDLDVGPPGPYPPEIGCLMIMLQQDGSGTTWFDDLEVIPIK